MITNLKWRICEYLSGVVAINTAVASLRDQLRPDSRISGTGRRPRPRAAARITKLLRN